jgi:cellulose synthase/poly-beta-1,6-N-acetylglucosamine synthase-like glycosyltransferase
VFRELVTYTAFLFVLATAAVMVAGHRLRRAHPLLSLAVGGGMAAAAAAAVSPGGVLPWLALVLATVALALAVALAFPRWNALGHAYFLATVAFSAAFFAYAVYVTAASHLGPLSLALAALLLVLELAALALFVAGTFEVVDVCCRVRWERAATPAPASGFAPFVSLHVPTYNEPPDLVIATLDALARLDYPRYEVLVVDNNTKDERLWRPVEAHCRRLGARFRFFHVDPWPGFKSGALNFALRRTSPGTALVGVVDADYLVEPEFLREAVGPFADPSVAIVQTPQDYREVAAQGRYGWACYRAYAAFFRLSMPMRNEYNGIIFVGTMGLVRRDVLLALGGWDEWCVTEDAELSLRVLAAGHRAVYLDRTYGRGLMPFDFAALKRQRFRWAFGGMQILRLHARLLFGPPRGGAGPRLTPAQRLCYLVGGLQWLTEPVTFGFTLLLLLGAGALALGGSLYLQPLVGATVIMPLVLLALGIARYLWAFRVRAGCTLREAWDAFTVMLGLSWVVTLACVLGLTKRRGVFLRTPKQRERYTLRDALRVVRWETALAALCLLVGVGLALRQPGLGSLAQAVLLGLLAWHALLYSASLRAALWSRGGAGHPSARRLAARLGGRLGAAIGEGRLAAGLGAAALALALLFFAAVRLAPAEERAYRTDPGRGVIGGRALVPSGPQEDASAVVFLEERGVLAGDVEGVLSLWAPDGEVVDANYAPDDPAGYRVWRGLAAVRERYREELAARHYLRLHHAQLSFTTDGTTAVVVNDLAATIQTADGVQEVYLPRSDQWTLVREGDRWRIRRLVVNLAHVDRPSAAP